MSVDHDIVMTRQKIYMWKYDTLVFAVFYVIVTSVFKTTVFYINIHIGLVLSLQGHVKLSAIAMPEQTPADCSKQTQQLPGRVTLVADGSTWGRNAQWNRHRDVKTRSNIKRDRRSQLGAYISWYSAARLHRSICSSNFPAPSCSGHPAPLV